MADPGELAVTAGVWYIVDPGPVDRTGPVLVGPFSSEREALQWANEQHPDDLDAAVALQPTTPEAYDAA